MAFRALFAVRVATFVAILAFFVFMLQADAFSINGGKRIKGDRQLFKNTTKVPANQGIQQNHVCYPKYLSTRVNITKYEVNDLMPFGRGGVPQVYSGGINKTSVCFLLQSSPRQAYNFTITVWGFRR